MMLGKDCKMFRGRIGPYLDGELAEAEVKGVRSHLRGCPECAALLKQYTAVDEIGRAQFYTGPPEEYFDALSQKILKATVNSGSDQAAVNTGERKYRVLVLSIRFVMAAAAAVIFFMIYSLFTRIDTVTNDLDLALTGFEKIKPVIPPKTERQQGRTEPVPERKSVKIPGKAVNLPPEQEKVTDEQYAVQETVPESKTTVDNIDLDLIKPEFALNADRSVITRARMIPLQKNLKDENVGIPDSGMVISADLGRYLKMNAKKARPQQAFVSETKVDREGIETQYVSPPDRPEVKVENPPPPRGRGGGGKPGPNKPEKCIEITGYYYAQELAAQKESTLEKIKIFTILLNNKSVDGTSKKLAIHDLGELYNTLIIQERAIDTGILSECIRFYKGNKKELSSILGGYYEERLGLYLRTQERINQ